MVKREEIMILDVVLLVTNVGVGYLNYKLNKKSFMYFNIIASLCIFAIILYKLFGFK
jgi:hypothetical protein